MTRSSTAPVSHVVQPLRAPRHDKTSSPACRSPFPTPEVHHGLDGTLAMGRARPVLVFGLYVTNERFGDQLVLCLASSSGWLGT